MEILEVTTPAAHHRLTTPERVQEEVTTLTDEPRAIQLIDEASAAIASYLGRALAVQEYVERLAGFGGPILQLRYTPIVGQPTVVGPDSLAITDFTIDRDNGWLRREVGWVWTAQRSGFVDLTPIPGTERLDFAVTYRAGYVLPGDDDENPRTLPFDIERACIELVRAVASAPDPDVASERIGDYAITYRDRPADAGMLPPRVEALLARHRGGR
jgi:hypothetical protein